MGFLQTKTASVLRDLSITADMGPVDRQVLASFLSGKNRGASTDPVAGILSEMKEKYEKDLNATTTDEANAVQGLEDLVAAKEKEIEALGQSIESKAIRSGEIAVKHSEMLNDYEDTQEELAKNKKFLVSLDSSCDQKRKEWSAYQQLQSQESLALADTIKILNDDDALELFKKTLPKASLLQFKVSDKRTRQRALDVLRRHPHSSVQLQFVELALRGGKQGFDKIVALMDQLMAQLKNDQKEDDEKKDYCENEIDKTHDKKKSLQHAASDMEIVIDDAQEYISNLKVEIEALDDGIRALDKEVEEATSNRKEAHEEYVQAAAENKASVDIIKFAKRRLNKFYNPSQVQPVKRKLSEEEQIQANMGYSFVQIRDDADDADDQAPPPPPEADLGYTTKGEESAGVIRMMDNLVNDVEKDMQESDLEEKDAQRDYEEFMDNAATKRAEDSKAITDKTVALGNTEEELSNGKEGLRNTNQKLMETEKYLGSLHAECDWLMKYYDTRKEARSGEIDSMEKAKAVLNGADYSM
jgi:chromosome segregation ATPase